MLASSGPPAHKTPADAGLDGDHREGVGHDVVQLASDADPLFADLLAGELGLGGALPLRLLGQSGLVAPPGRDAVADEPGRRQRQERFDGLGGGR